MPDKSLQICTRCVMDNASDVTISFADDGTCNYCNDVLQRIQKEYHPNAEGKRQLELIMSKIKSDGTGKEYDCIVGVSGGLDSTYVLYLGHRYNLRMLAVHIDDGLDTDIAKRNIVSICDKTQTKLLSIRPDIEQYRDLLLSFFIASVPNLAAPQDNIIISELLDACKKYDIRYSLSGSNFAMESILERSTGINACDKKHINAIHKLFGKKRIDKLHLISLVERYLYQPISNSVYVVKPLNFIKYNLNEVLRDLKEFCDYQYYGGKHYESILCRFMQCWYLPMKYNMDKRKSHFSSLILSGQMTRTEALEKLSQPPYISKELQEFDFNYLANYLGLSRKEFNDLINQKPNSHYDYPRSILNNYAGIARKFRKYLGA
ncbi:N-acetyl sugar amidotransferase [Cloacibacillus porcorum]